MNLKDAPFPKVVSLTEEEIYTIKLLQKGEADTDQQKIAFDLICKRICRLGFNPHTDGDPYTTSYNSGIQKVGQIVAYIAATPFDELMKEEK